MKRLTKTLAVLALLSMALGILVGPGGWPAPVSGARADIGKPGDSLQMPNDFPKPGDFTLPVKPEPIYELGPINPNIFDILDTDDDPPTAPPTDPPTAPPITEPPTAPPVTNPPVTNPPVTNPPVTNPPVTNPPVTNPPSNENHQATNPPATNPPDDQKSGSGQYMTSEGPLFLSFRQDLTEQLYMFTPMDLSLDGEYHFPLIGDTSQVVGEAKVVVQSGMTIVTYLLVNGVKLNEKDEFFTFFRDIDSPASLKPSKLQSVKLKFGMPYSVAKWLDSDPNVLLYINCPVSYKSSLSGLTPFSFQDPGYLSRMMALLPLMD